MLNYNKNDNFLCMIEHLQNDDVVLSASDTVLGLFAQLSEKSKNKLDAIKQRNVKPYIILLPSLVHLDKFIDQTFNEKMNYIVKTYWPGPLTIVLKAKVTLPDWLKSQQDTIAIRIPNHQGLQAILHCTGSLFTTSANMSDQPLPKKLFEIDPVILQQVFMYDVDQNKMYDGLASTILDFSHGDIRIIRQGSVKIDAI